RVPEAALVALRTWRIRLEISARQVVEQHVVADVEQVSPPPRQVIKDRLLVHQQPIVTAVQLVDLGQPGILTQQIGHGTALKPLTVQPPLAARRQQTVDDQREQDLIPTRPFLFREADIRAYDPKRDATPAKQPRRAKATAPETSLRSRYAMDPEAIAAGRLPQSAPVVTSAANPITA